MALLAFFCRDYVIKCEDVHEYGNILKVKEKIM